MAVKREVARVADDSLWDAFVDSSPQGNVFSTSGWMRAAAETQGGEPVMLGVFENGMLTGGAAFLAVKRGPLRKATAPVLAPYGGFLFAPFAGTRPSEEESRNAACADALIGSLRARYHHVLLIHDPRYGDMREFIGHGFSCRVKYTYVLDITDTAKLWEIMEPRTRTTVRKAESALAVRDGLDIRTFGELYERVYLDRDNRPPIPRATVERLVTALMRRGLAEMRTAFDAGGTPLASHVVMFDHRSVYGLVNGAVPEASFTGAFSLLVWDTVRRHGGSRERYDLTGANLPSIAFFKKGFGGRLTPYFATERYSSPFMHAVFAAYAGVHKVLS